MERTVELGSLISPAKTVRCGDGNYPILSMTMHSGLVFQDDKFKKVIASKDTSDYKVVYRNQLVISFPIDEGVLAAQRITDAGIVSPAYGIWDIDQSKIMPEFLEYALRCNRAIQYYKAKLRGSTARRRSLPTPTLLAFTVPLPDIDGQNEILDRIHRASAVIEKRKAQVKMLDDLIKARFVEMFGCDRDYIIKAKHRVADICEARVGIVIQPTQYYTDDVENGVKAFRSLNVKPFYVNDTDWVFFFKDNNNMLTRTQVHANDVAVVRSGANLGDSCVIPSQYDGCNAIDILLLTCNSEVLPLYLSAFINYPVGKNQILNVQRGGAIKHLNLKQLEQSIIFVPAMEKQNEFATFVARVDKSKAAVQKALDEAQLLFDSLMQQYFG